MAENGEPKRARRAADALQASRAQRPGGANRADGAKRGGSAAPAAKRGAGAGGPKGPNGPKGANGGKPAKPGKGGKPKKKGSKIKSFFKWFFIVGLAFFLVGVIAALVFYQTTELPDANEEFTTQTTTLYFNDGKTPLGELSVQNRTVINYDQMPASIKDAVVAAEDRTFWTNSGIDLKGMTRAALRILKGENIQGGSTITQQYIKTLYLTSDQTITRKVREVVLANKLNKAESKESVLEGYLNTIYFGRDAYGVEAAAEAYFGIHAKDLNLSQSVMLASVLNSPSALDPANGDEAKAALQERYNYVLEGMLDPMKTITQKDYDDNYNKLPDTIERKADNVYAGTNGFLVRMAIDELKNHGLTDEQISGGGLKIITTFDPGLQQAAIDAARANVAKAVERARPLTDENGNIMRDENGNPVKPDPSKLHVGLVSIDNATGEVVAIYGGDDYVKNSRNWALTPRYAGSTFKVYGIVAGLRDGLTLNTPLRGNTFTPEGDTVPVSNDSGQQLGSLTLSSATVYSSNTAFVDVMTKIPNAQAALIKAANDAGVPEHSSWKQQGLRLVLGEGEVSALNNATGFSTIASAGMRHETHVVRKATDFNGRIVYTGNTQGVQAIEKDVAINTTIALSRAAEGAQRNAVRCDVAGKTGTEGVQVGQRGVTQTVTRAAWLAGFTKQLTTAVLMVAGDDGNQNLDVYAPWGGTFYGATYPTSIWADYMAVASKNYPCEKFDSAPKPTVTPSAVQEPTEQATEPSEEPGEDWVTIEPETTQPVQPTETQPAPPAPPTQPAPPPTTSAPPPAPPTTSNPAPAPSDGDTDQPVG